MTARSAIGFVLLAGLILLVSVLTLTLMFRADCVNERWFGVLLLINLVGLLALRLL
jgi:hypothetical protein